MELSERRSRILKSVVDRYVDTNEPVSSSLLSEQFHLSSASIRNEMNQLLQVGYLTQAHTSGGRIPTDTGYRFFVDALMDEAQIDRDGHEKFVKCLQAIQLKLDEMFRELSESLSDSLGYLAFMSLPQADSSRITRIELAPVSAHCCLVALVLSNGTVESKLVELPFMPDEQRLRRTTEMLNRRLSGRRLQEMDSEKLDRAFREVHLHEENLRAALTLFFEELALSLSGVFYLCGTDRILEQPEFMTSSSLRPVLEAVNGRAGRNYLMEIPEGEGMVDVYIGQENAVDALKQCSLVKGAFRFGDGTSGVVGVVGPTRMHYPLAVGCVRYLAHSLSRKLGAFLGA